MQFYWTVAVWLLIDIWVYSRRVARSKSLHISRSSTTCVTSREGRDSGWKKYWYRGISSSNLYRKLFVDNAEVELFHLFDVLSSLNSNIEKIWQFERENIISYLHIWILWLVSIIKKRDFITHSSYFSCSLHNIISYMQHFVIRLHFVFANFETFSLVSYFTRRALCWVTVET